MDDALNTSSFRQPNTFMDIAAPNKSPRRGEPNRSNTLMRSAVKKPVPTVAELQNLPKVQTGFNASDHTAAASYSSQSPFVTKLSTSIYDEPVSEPVSTPIQQQYPSMETEAPAEFPSQIEVEQEPLMNSAYTEMAEAVPMPSFNVFNPSVPQVDTSFVEATGDTLRQGFRKIFSGWSVLGVAVIGIVACAVFINSHINNVEFYLASSKAGFSATLPSIKPSGFNLSGISTGSGAIEASFKSNSDNRAYNISEKKSSISSQDLQNGYVMNQAGLNYQTLKTNGKTIFIYNSNDATWENNGIWYVLQDNNFLVIPRL